jgi:hypothetical protein
VISFAQKLRKRKYIFNATKQMTTLQGTERAARQMIAQDVKHIRTTTVHK